MGDALFFRANDGSNGNELWKSDGTATGTVMVKDIYPGSSGGFSAPIADLSGTAYFQAQDGVSGIELWKSDGTATGTVMVKDIRPGASHSTPAELTAVEGKLLFSANDGVLGQELWWSDGTATGTVMIADVRLGSTFSPNIHDLVPIRDEALGLTRVFFSARDNSKGQELWLALVNPNPVADLSVTKKDSIDPVYTDDPLTYTVGVANSGPGAATGVVLTDTLPAGSTFVSATSTQGSCGESAGVVTCGLDVMGTGTQATATIRIFTPATTGTITNLAAVGSNEEDPVPGNNTSTESTEVVEPPPISDLSITKTVFQALVATGVPIHYTITIRNDGPSVANNVTVTDVLPPGVLSTSVTPSPSGSCVVTPTGAVCDMGAVAKRAEVTVTVVAVASAAGTITNSASVVATQSDPDNSNNTASVQSLVVVPPIVELVKDIRPGFSSATPNEFADIDGVLFFSAFDPTNGRELWKSDGTEEGTVFVKDIRPGSNGSFPQEITNVGGVAFFVAYEDAVGYELWKSDGTATGTVMMKDIRAGVSSGLSSGTAYLTELNGILFFAAHDGASGTELWKSDGTATGTVMVKDILPGASGSSPSKLVVANGILFFTANDGTNSTELWKSDGTATGTVMVKDIRNGFFGSFPDELVNVGGTLFFAAVDSTNDDELWKSDGTATGTVMVKNIDPVFSSSPTDLTAVGNTLYFGADDNTHGRELWKSDGTATGTVMVKDIAPGLSSGLSFGAALLTGSSSTVHFVAADGVHGKELWRSDGTAAGTVMVMDIRPGANGSTPADLAYVNPLLFTAYEQQHGTELWISNGTTTFLVKNIRSGGSSSSITEILPVFSDRFKLYQVFFDANNGSKGRELWKVLVNPNPVADLSITKTATPTQALPIDTLTYTVTVTNNGPGAATGVELTDELPPGVAFVSAQSDAGSCSQAGGIVSCDIPILAPGEQATATIAVFTSSTFGVFITNTSTVSARETDPDPANNTFSLVVEIVAPPPFVDLSLTKTMEPPAFPVVGRPTGFRLTIENAGPGFAHNLTVTDTLPANVTYSGATASQGSCTESAGTVTCNLGTLLKLDVAHVTINVVANAVGKVINTATVSADETETDPSNNSSTIEQRVISSDPIVLVKDISPGVTSSVPFLITVVGNMVYFTAADGVNGFELWKSDLTPDGTLLVKDIIQGPNSTFINSLTDVAGALFFVADDKVNGRELWKSDGTATGTIMVKDIFPGIGDSFPAELTPVGAKVFFRANDGIAGTELWVSDGSPAGTFMVKDIFPGLGSSLQTFGGAGLTNVGGTLYFAANDGTNGNELWKTDGTAPGTVMVTDISPGISGSFPASLIDVGGTLFFSANEGTNGRELWKSDGTGAGTVMVKDINPQPFAWSDPQNLSDVDGRLYFVANDGVTGIELWKTDGTATGTLMVKDINPGASSGFALFGFANITHVTGTVFYFTANDGISGLELWKSDGTAAGTVMVKDINPGPAFAFFFFLTGEFTPADGHLFFVATDGVHGSEVWVSDGTEAGTLMVQDLNPGPPPVTNALARVNIIRAVPAEHEEQESSSLNDPTSSNPWDLRRAFQAIVFAAFNEAYGHELRKIPESRIDELISEVLVGAHLSVTKKPLGRVVRGGSVPRDGEIEYKVTVKNVGTETALGVVLTDQAPQFGSIGQVFLQSANNPNLLQATNECATASRTITCQVGDLSPQQEKSYVFELKLDSSVPPGTQLTNHAEASATNASTVTTQVTNQAIAHADISVLKVLDEHDSAPESVDEFVDAYDVDYEDEEIETTEGDRYVFTILVENHGPDDAVNVRLTDDLPADIQVLSDTLPASCSGPAPGSTFTCNLLTIPAGGSAIFSITFKVGEVPDTEVQGFQMSNDVSVTSDTPDFFTENQSAEVYLVAYSANEEAYQVRDDDNYYSYYYAPTETPDGPSDCGSGVECGDGTLDLPSGCTAGGCPDAGDPIYLHSGELYQYEEDLRIPGRGIDWVFARKYRSGIIYEGPLGHNWDFNYNRRLILATPQNAGTLPATGLPRKPQPGDVVRMDGLGRYDLYQLQTDGTFLSPAGFYTRLTSASGGGFVEWDQRGNSSEYGPPNSDGLSRLVAMRDRNGNTISFTYDTQGRLSQAVDTLGRLIDYSYDTHGRLASVTDFVGRSIKFAYDANGDLTEVTSPTVTSTPTGNNFPQGRTTRYTYSSSSTDPHLDHNLLTVTAPNEVAGGGPPRLILTYGTSSSTTLDRVLTQTLGGTNYSGVPAGGVIAYQYIVLTTTRRVGVNFPVSQTTVTDRNGNVTEYQFNRLSNIVGVREFTNRDLRPGEPDFYETRHEYNEDGQRLKTVFPEGNSVSYLYDDQNPDRQQQGNLLTVTRTPDADRGGDQGTIRVAMTYEPIYNQLRTITSPRGLDTSYAPQNGGLRTLARYTTKHTFDYEEACSAPAIASVTGRTSARVQQLLAIAGVCGSSAGDANQDGVTTQVHGNVVRTQQPSVTLLGGSNQATAEGDTIQEIGQRFVYNRFGQLVLHIDPEGNVDQYDYYPANDPDGDGLDVTTTTSSELGGYLARTVRDSKTRRIEADVNGDGNVNLQDLQSVAERIGKRDYLADLNGDGDVNVLDLVAIASKFGETGPPPTAYLRSDLAYDRVGNLVRQVDGRGVVTDYVVNELNQVVQIERAAAHGQFQRSTVEPPHLLINFNYLERLFYDHNGSLVLRQVEDRGNTSAVDGNPPSATLPPNVVSPDPVGGPAYVDTVHHYDILNKLVESVREVRNSTTPEMLTTRVRYDPNENRVLLVQPEGNATSWTYDERELVMRVTSGAPSSPPLALRSASDATVYDVRGGVSSTVAYHYDGNANLVERVDAADTDGSSANNSTVGGSGDRTRYIYDGFNRRTSVVDSAGNQSVIQYDPASNVVRLSRFGPAGGTTPTSDGPATLAAPVSSVGVIQPTALVGGGLLAATEYRYDELSRAYQTDRVLFIRPATTTARTPDLADGAVSIGKSDLTPGDTQAIQGVTGITIIGRVTTRSEYDRNSRLTFTVEDDGDTRRYEYDGADRLLRVADPAGNAVEYAYDGNSNVIETRETDVSQEPGLPDEVFLTTFFHDALNRPQIRVDNIGRAFRFRYDSRGNLVATADAEGPPRPDPVVRRAFSEGPRTINDVNTRGNVTISFYDGIGRRTQSDVVLTASGAGDGLSIGRDFFGVSSTIPQPDLAQGGGDGLVTTRYEWGQNSLLRSITDDNGNQTQYAYDNLDRRTAVTKGFCVPPALADRCDATTTVAYEYDRDHNVARVTDENGSVITYTYDAPNRRTAADVIRATGVTGTTAVRYEYDGLSRRTRATDNNEPSGLGDDSVVTYIYDSLGRLVEEGQRIGTGPTRAVSSGWRADGLRTSLTYPNGRALDYRYDELDRLKSVQDSGATQELAVYQYIGATRVAGRAYPINGTGLALIDFTAKVDVGYDGIRRPVELRHGREIDQTLIAGFAQRYDRMSNKLTEEKLHAPGDSELYAYDSAYRLTDFQRGTLNSARDAVVTASALGPLHSSWALDGAGNWEQVDGETRKHSSFNEIVERSDGGVTAVLSDDNGNVTDDGTLLFAWDYLNRLRTVTRKSDGALIATYSYDAAGRRIRKVVTNSGPLVGFTDFSYDGRRVIEERDGSGALLQQYVYGRGLDEALSLDRNVSGGTSATEAGDRRLYYHANSLGSVFALTDGAGAIVEGYQYDAYGRPTVFKPGANSVVDFGGDDIVAVGGTSSEANPYMFAGRRLDPETGLYYNRRRYLSPELGRFLSRDPMGYGGGGLGLFEYAGGRPTRATDPLGLAPVGGPCAANASDLQPYAALSNAPLLNILGPYNPGANGVGTTVCPTDAFGPALYPAIDPGDERPSGSPAVGGGGGDLRNVNWAAFGRNERQVGESDTRAFEASQSPGTAARMAELDVTFGGTGGGSLCGGADIPPEGLDDTVEGSDDTLQVWFTEPVVQAPARGVSKQEDLDEGDDDLRVRPLNLKAVDIDAGGIQGGDIGTGANNIVRELDFQ